MILETSSKVLISHRRLYDGDHTRFFVGVVEGYEAGIVRVCGHTWLRDGYQGLFRRKDDERTKVFSLASGTVMVYALPSTTDMTSLRFSIQGAEVYLEDEAGLRMDLSEGLLHGAPTAVRAAEKRAG